MSKNYIKVLLNPFRESKVVAELLKWIEAGGTSSGPSSDGGKKEVRAFFFFFFLLFGSLGGYNLFFLCGRCQLVRLAWPSTARGRSAV